MAATLFHNVTGSTGVDVELLAPGDGVNNIRSITITNIHDTANATVALRIYRDATAKTFKEATPEQQRIATDLTKSPKKGTAFGKPTDPASYGLPRGPENPDRGYQIAKYWPDGTTETPWGRKLEPGKKNRVTNADKLAAYNNRWKYQGLTQPNKWGKHTRK